MMYTQPNQVFLKRQYNEDQELKYLSDLLEEIVNYGSNILGWYSPKAAPGLVPCVMLRNAIQSVDGISVIFKNGITGQARPILRGFVKNYIHLTFIFHLPDSRQPNPQYALNFIYYRTAESKKAWEKERNTLTEINRVELQRRLSKCVEGVLKCEQMMQSDSYKESYREYNRLKKLKSKNGKFVPFSWYTMHHPNKKNKPRNLRSLAGYLDLDNIYEDWYAPLSSAAHSTNIIDDSFSITEGPMKSYVLKPIRSYNLIAARNMVVMIIRETLLLYDKFIAFFASEQYDEFRIWHSKIDKHLREVKKRCDDLYAESEL